MAKTPTVTTVQSGFNSQETINANFQTLADAFTNTVSRDGSVPNTMEADFDLNGNNIVGVNNLTADRLVVGGSLIAVSADPVFDGTVTTIGVNILASETGDDVLDNLGLTVDVADLNDFSSLTSSITELNLLTGATVSTTEINYLDGVTSSIQTQLDSKYEAVTQDTATWEAGVGTTESLVSPAKVNAAIVEYNAEAEQGWVELESFDMSGLYSQETSAFEDGYEYMIQLRNASYPTTGERAAINVYKETDAAYHTGEIILTNHGNDATADDSWCQCFIPLARTVTSFRVFEPTGHDDSNLSTISDDLYMQDAGATKPVSFVTFGTAQKIGKVLLKENANGIFTSGTFVVFRKKL